jgi:hypothetical protein
VDEPDAPDVDLSELRALLGDVHHGLHHEDIKGKADAAALTVRRARESGVPKDVADQMATEVFQQLIREIPSSRRKQFWWRRQRESTSEREPAALPRGTERRALPSGD